MNKRWKNIGMALGAVGILVGVSSLVLALDTGILNSTNFEVKSDPGAYPKVPRSLEDGASITDANTILSVEYSSIIDLLAGMSNDDGSDIEDETSNRLGIFTDTPDVRLDVNGGVGLWYESADCEGSLEGAIRYNILLDRFEGCDGTDWSQLDCTPDCAGRVCGSDGCGGYCVSPDCSPKNCDSNDGYLLSGDNTIIGTSMCEDRDYLDEPTTCDVLGQCSDPTCSTYDALSTLEAGPCFTITGCSDTTAGTLVQSPEGTPCGGGQFCGADGSCCVPNEGEISNDPATCGAIVQCDGSLSGGSSCDTTCDGAGDFQTCDAGVCVDHAAADCTYEWVDSSICSAPCGTGSFRREANILTTENQCGTCAVVDGELEESGGTAVYDGSICDSGIPCESYYWEATAWSECSDACGEGTQTTDVAPGAVDCRQTSDGASVSSMLCNAGLLPLTQSCTTFVAHDHAVCDGDDLYWADCNDSKNDFIQACAFGCTGGVCDGCVAETCGDIGAECGDHVDICGNALNCDTPGCSTIDCDGLDTVCRNYHDVPETCASGTCVAGSCTSYTNVPVGTVVSGGVCDGSGNVIECTTAAHCTPDNSCEVASCVGNVCQSNPDPTTVVDGGWSSFGAWGCADSDTRSQSRTCTNPAPACGGATCIGSTTNTEECTGGDVCSSGVCTANCTPKTCVSEGYACGTWNDGCGGTFSCGSCSGSKNICNNNVNSSDAGECGCNQTYVRCYPVGTLDQSSIGWRNDNGCYDTTCNTNPDYCKEGSPVSLSCPPPCTPTWSPSTSTMCGTFTQTNSCDGSTRTATGTLSCNDGNPCTNDLCSSGTCIHPYNSSTASCTNASVGTTCTGLTGTKTCSGGSYGECVATTDPTVANCSGDDCGSDGCGGTCGMCSGGTPYCDGSKQCVGCLSDVNCSTDYICNDSDVCQSCAYTTVEYNTTSYTKMNPEVFCKSYEKSTVTGCPSPRNDKNINEGVQCGVHTTYVAETDQTFDLSQTCQNGVCKDENVLVPCVGGSECTVAKYYVESNESCPSPLPSISDGIPCTGGTCQGGECVPYSCLGSMANGTKCTGADTLLKADGTWTAVDLCGLPKLLSTPKCQFTCNAGYVRSGSVCMPCQPNCSGATCGGDDGCGGTCKSGSCPAGYSCDGNGTCDPLCWKKSERTKTVVVLEADAVNVKFTASPIGVVDPNWLGGRRIVSLRNNVTSYSHSFDSPTCGVGADASTTCGVGTSYAVVHIDNPSCASNVVNCPYGYSGSDAMTATSDSCWDKDGALIGGKWVDRQRKTCYKIESVNRCYGDSCRPSTSSTSLYGKMSSTGSCCSASNVGSCVNSSQKVCYCGEHCYYVSCSTGGTGGGGCFTPETQVEMSDGTMRSIESVNPGDWVRGSEGANQVMRRYRIEYDGLMYSINGSSYFATETHPFLTTEGWKSFNPLATMKETPGLNVTLFEIGDELITDDGIVVLDSFDSEHQTTTVYNFDVSNTHDFYADGYLVHNVSLENGMLIAVADLLKKDEIE